jgi:hypothetical protein
MKSLFSMVARATIVPVARSTLLSRKVRVPLCSVPLMPGTVTSAATAPRARAAWIVARSVSLGLKVTYIGSSWTRLFNAVADAARSVPTDAWFRPRRPENGARISE